MNNQIKRNQDKITHGFCNHRLYPTWLGMMQRCYNPKRPNYKYYGGRGITVCKEWLNVESFINDMYPTFQEGLTLDRINVDREYSKENCRWADSMTQSKNKRKK